MTKGANRWSIEITADVDWLRTEIDIRKAGYQANLWVLNVTFVKNKVPFGGPPLLAAVAR